MPGLKPSPNEELAAIVARELVAQGLVAAAQEEEVRQGLADGTLRERDWLALVRPRPGEEPERGEWD